MSATFLTVLITTGLIAFLVMTRVKRDDVIAKQLCGIIKPHQKFRQFYAATFDAVQNPQERDMLLNTAATKEHEFDLRVSTLLATHASRKDLKAWLKFYRAHPDTPFKHASDKFNQTTTTLAADMVDTIMTTARDKMNHKDDAHADI